MRSKLLLEELGVHLRNQLAYEFLISRTGEEKALLFLPHLQNRTIVAAPRRYTAINASAKGCPVREAL